MLPLQIPDLGGRPLRLLCLGAHSDDLEIGCGATVARLLAGTEPVEVRWEVLSATGRRADEARASAEHLLRRAKSSKVRVSAFRDGYFPAQWEEIKEFFETLEGEPSPDLVFTHFRADRHQDHRVVSDLTWNSFRDHVVLEYEVPKFDGDLGSPNVFVALDRVEATSKVEAILEVFLSQRDKPWLDVDCLLGLMRLRGMECRAPGGFAEAFYARKLRAFED